MLNPRANLEHSRYDILITRAMLDRVGKLLIDFEPAFIDEPEENTVLEIELGVETAISSGNSIYFQLRAVCDPFDELRSPVESVRARNMLCISDPWKNYC